MQVKMSRSKFIPVILLTAMLSGCGGNVVTFDDQQDSAPGVQPDLSSVPDAVPKVEPRSRYGNPASYEVRGKRYFVRDSADGYVQQGIASWYGTKFHGRRTSSGEPYDMFAMTAAHKSLPLPTYVEVTNLRNGRKVVLKVNDRGPFHQNRIIDLSFAAAKRLGITAKGTGLVEVRAINPNATAAPVPVVQAAAPVTSQPVVKATAQPSAPPIASTDLNTQVSMFLQVGAFISRGNAERLQSKLRNAAITDSAISQTSSAGNTVYRVRIGPIANVDDADKLSVKLSSLGLPDARVVID